VTSEDGYLRLIDAGAERSVAWFKTLALFNTNSRTEGSHAHKVNRCFCCLLWCSDLSRMVSRWAISFGEHFPCWTRMCLSDCTVYLRLAVKMTWSLCSHPTKRESSLAVPVILPLSPASLSTPGRAITGLIALRVSARTASSSWSVAFLEAFFDPFSPGR
jgi:hypothetical protein